jgi:hypothetical protein
MKNMKLIMESWRSFLHEKEGTIEDPDLKPSEGGVTGNEEVDKKMFEFFIEFLPGGSRHGEDPELCELNIPGTELMCQDNLGIPRSEMPQLKTTDDEDLAEAFSEYLESQGHSVAEGTEFSADLKATQSQLKGAKVNGMNSALVSGDGNHPGIRAPIIVSSDNYVLDGHHRWASQLVYDFMNGVPKVEVEVRKVNLPIRELLELSKYDGEFCQEYGCVPPEGR